MLIPARLKQLYVLTENSISSRGIVDVGRVKTLTSHVWKIVEQLNSNAELKLRLTTCQNVFCGVVKQLVGNGIEVGSITITADMIESAFKTKYGL